MLCHASVERLFDLSYVKVRAFLCALNRIRNIAELVSGCFILGMDQALPSGVDLNFVFLEDSSEFFSDRPATYGITTSLRFCLFVSGCSLCCLFDASSKGD